MARTYVVGLPVGVVIGDDGSVHLSIDAAELTVAMREDWATPEGYTEDDIDADVAAAEAAYAASTITTSTMQQQEEGTS